MTLLSTKREKAKKSLEYYEINRKFFQTFHKNKENGSDSSIGEQKRTRLAHARHVAEDESHRGYPACSGFSEYRN